MKKAVFIERDGVLNQAFVNGRQQVGPASLAEFRLQEGVLPLLARLKEAGFLLLVTTNQPGIARGDLSRRELDRMHDQLRRLIPVDDIFICPHDDPDRCPCRKPRPGLFQEARCKWQLNMNASFVVSDKWQDVEAARSAGCTSILIRSAWNGAAHPDLILQDFGSVVEKILSLQPPQAPSQPPSAEALKISSPAKTAPAVRSHPRPRQDACRKGPAASGSRKYSSKAHT